MEIAITIAAIAYVALTTFVHRRTARTLAALRHNCFITNEKGHRVRYIRASAECRAIAETSCN